jgi:AcrR family transcriptional regulator
MAAMSTRTSPRQARSAKTLDLLLDSAERLYHERGVVETSTVDIAADAQVSVGRLYYWFPDKDAVTEAVMQRSEDRFRTLLAGVMAEDLSEKTGDLVSRVLGGLATFFVTHPGTLAVLARGPIDGVDPGQSLARHFHQLAGGLVESRVPGIDAAERDLVASVIMRIVIGMMCDFVVASPERRPIVLQELRYVLAAYLQARYPSERDRVWDDPNHSVRPSNNRNRVRLGDVHAKVYPALSEPV